VPFPSKLNCSAVAAIPAFRQFTETLPSNGLFCLRKRRRKGSPVPEGYKWATLSLGDINTGTWASGLGGWTQG
jgi:hypothetical protein